MAPAFSRRLLKRLAPIVAGFVLLTQLVAPMQACVLTPAVEPCHDQDTGRDAALHCHIHCISQAQVTNAAKVPVPSAPEPTLLTAFPVRRVVWIEIVPARLSGFAPSAAPPPLTVLLSRFLI